MSYQVNLSQNTSVYVNKREEPGLVNAKQEKPDVTKGSLQAATQADEGLSQILSGEEIPSGAQSAQVMKNTEQYMELLEKNGAGNGEAEDVESDEQARERKKEIYKNLTSEEIAKLKMMQVDLSAVSLSDIAGLVAGIRSEASRQEFAQKIADICGGIDSVQGKLFHDNLKDVLKSILPEEMSGLAMDSVLEEGYVINEQQMIYLLKNDLQLTLANLYKAEYATGSGSSKAQADTLDARALKLLMPQIDSLIDQADVSRMGSAMTREELTQAARFMIEHHIALTPDAMQNYAAIREINENGIDASVLASNILFREAYGEPIESANVFFSEQQAAKSLESIIAGVSGQIIHAAEHKGIAYTLHNLAVLQEEYADSNDSMENQEAYVSDNEVETEVLSKSELTARRQLEEIRLSMTQEAACRLVMADIHIDTKELSELVQKLRSVEQAMAKETFTEYGMPYTREGASLYQDTMHKVTGLAHMPAAVIAFAARPDTVTINTLYERGTGEAFKAALQSYETVMTTPRADMGDSISKAFAQIDSLLAGMNMEPTEPNRRAVRILGYNQMELTPENLAEIKNADTKVNRMLTEMTPKAVLKLIRNQKNPLEMSVDELCQALQEGKEEQDTERFSEFLYKLQHKGEISPAERQSFIGIYRLLDKIQKNSGRDIGFVVKAGQELTMKNLLSAHRSNQAKGMEFTVSDESGAMESITSGGASISQQIEAAFIEYGQSVMDNVMEELTPEGLSGVLEEMRSMDMEKAEPAYSGSREGISADEKASDSTAPVLGEQKDNIEILANSDMLLETFAGRLRAYADRELSARYANQLYEQAGAMEFSEEAERFAIENQISYSQGNLYAIESMLENQAGIYGMLKDMLANTAGKKLRDKYDAMLQSISEDFDSEQTVLDSLAALSDTLQEDVFALAESGSAYREEIIAEEPEDGGAGPEAVRGESDGPKALEGIITYRDIQAMKQIQAGFSILKSMAGREKFQIPIQVDGTWTVLNVSFVNSVPHSEDSEELAGAGGSIIFSMAQKRLGRLSASITTGSQAAGSIETEEAGTLEWPEEILKRAEQAVTKKDRYGLAKEIFSFLATL